MGDRSAQNRHGHREVEEGCHRICLERRCPQGRGEPTLGATLSILLSAGIVKGTLFLETNLPSSLLPFLFDEITGRQFFLSLSIVSNYKKWFSKSGSCQAVTISCLLQYRCSNSWWDSMVISHCERKSSFSKPSLAILSPRAAFPMTLWLTESYVLQLSCRTAGLGLGNGQNSNYSFY